MPKKPTETHTQQRKGTLKHNRGYERKKEAKNISKGYNKRLGKNQPKMYQKFNLNYTEMKNISKGANQQPATTRNRYTAAQKEKAQKLYMKGISVIEIAELLNINLPTVKRWRAAEKWKIIKEVTVINKRTEAKKLREAGFKKIDIARKLEIGVTTVYRYLKNEDTKEA